MDRNLKLLDRVDKKENIYRVIAFLSKRAHELISGGPAGVEIDVDEPAQIVMEEFLEKEKGNE
ncbi:DNA-directed RNA polymerase subunit omega [bacterium]|nr:DNA-directed RNA polymerase subunit omega [bacterium]